MASIAVVDTNSLAKADELRRRTKKFAIRIVNVFRSLPRSADAQILGKQALRSGTSVAANYRAACRARSKAEFISKIGTVVEEADETVFWLEILTETGIVRAERIQDLLIEGNELLAIFAASLQTAKKHQQK
ncbi:MAG: four helix bundle protein [Acidobacteria bacterium]|nr:MAG: four helix bundle protein [Acidobacteriota bacterium]